MSVAEPVVRWAPDVSADRVNAAPKAIPRGNAIDYGILPVQFLQGVVIAVEDLFRVAFRLLITCKEETKNEAQCRTN